MRNELEIFNNLSIPASLLDTDGIRIDANPAFAQFLQRSKQEIINLKAEEIYVKEDIPALMNALQECIKFGYSSAECKMLRGDGKILNYIIYFSTIKDKKGNIKNILATGIDLTELKKKETELKKTINLFGEVLEAASNGEWKGINLVDLGSEYIQIGKNINKIIEDAQMNYEEMEIKEINLKSAILSLSETLDKTVVGDLSARVDIGGWDEELATIGMAINTLIATLEFEKNTHQN